ncbi:MAG: alkaline phosphatase family protein [Oligoflexales bacterium]|nr:alkaline phosphatase family protein [Oligoflexales bacterium]
MDRRFFVKSSMAFGLGISHYSFGSLITGPSRRTYAAQSLNRICLGSCNDQDLSQEFWPKIAQRNPDLWVWLGDNIYADYASPEERQVEYFALQRNRYYESFAETVPMVGIWDDHDFAYDNSDGNYQDKDQSQEAFCNFLRLPSQHILRSSQGIYQSFVYGGAGAMDRRVHLILLDLRYFKEGDHLLGEGQWQWLANELLTSPGDLIMIGSSIAVLSEFTGFGLEGWASYKAERQRLFELLELCRVTPNKCPTH